MNNGIGSQHGPDDGDLVEQAHRPIVGPTTIVLEIQEHLPAPVQRSAHSPEYANKHNESHCMPNQTDHLDRREYSRPHRVQDDGQYEQPQEYQEHLPAGEDEIRVRDVDADAHEVGAHVHAAREAGDPPQAGHPPRRVAGLLLPSGGRELGDPVVLPSRRGAHAGHLGEREDDGGVAEHGADKGPEEAAVARRRDGGGHGDDYKLPGGHVDGHEAECGPEGEVALELLGLSQADHVGLVLGEETPGGCRLGGGDVDVVVLHGGREQRDQTVRGSEVSPWLMPSGRWGRREEGRALKDGEDEVGGGPGAQRHAHIFVRVVSSWRWKSRLPPMASGGSSVVVRIRASRAVPDCPASMISAVDAVVSPICREPPSTWPAVSNPGDAAASRGSQGIWSSRVPDRLPLYPVMLLPAGPRLFVWLECGYLVCIPGPFGV